uniref:Uncharacterized protein n=1 Tax=uncultured Armatimonadetes bacterium TaxID=157466 RepID=A0A6J4JQN4_9BACT|nr:hypothetical protein AVDCRST_MAG63-3873 [uncultured Armatimonadetes bacterium]
MVAAEALRPLIETFRRTGHEVFLQNALRIVKSIGDRLAAGALTPDDASPEHLAAAIEGVLFVSRESENDDMLALAARLGLVLRARRQPDGSLGGSIPATLATARAALALARVDGDAILPLTALRALRAAARLAQGGAPVRLADHAAFCALPAELLLTLGARVAQGVADRDALTLTRAWQLFQPDANARDFLQVRAKEDEAPVDYLALVCPFNLQVLVVALAGPEVGEVVVTKNRRAPYLKNLLTGEYDQRARLVPLGDGREAHFGVFLADT